MKLYSVAAFAFLLFQQNWYESIVAKGRAGVVEEIDKTLIPRVQNYFPGAKWIPGARHRANSPARVLPPFCSPCPPPQSRTNILR